MRTKMKQEIFDQYEVSKNIIEKYKKLASVLNVEIKRKQNLYLMGTGASLNACNAAKPAFMKYCGFLPHVVAATEIDSVVEVVKPDSLVILVSQSGQSYETQQAVKTLKTHHIEFWGITNNADSFLKQQANRSLLLNAGVEVSSATKTYMATVLILYLLAAGNNPEALNEIAKIPEDIRKTLDILDEKIDKIADEFLNIDNIYLVGIGFNGSTASQGALLLKEKTFKYVEGLSLAEFRHGTVEVIKPGLPIFLSGCTLKKVKEVLFHGEYLAAKSAKVYLIVDEPIESSILTGESIINIENNASEEFSHIATAIFYQLLAESIAFQKGYDVDGFKYLSKVVDKY